MWDNNVIISSILMCHQLQDLLGLADQHAHASGPLIVIGCVVKEIYKESTPHNVYILNYYYYLLLHGRFH